MGTTGPALLETRGLSKQFPGVRALSNVSFTLLRGEIHALMGENGAGKSTLIKLLTGVERPDAGEVLLAGANIAPRSPHQARELGISTVYQEVNLCPNLSVAENIFTGRAPRRWGRIDWRAVHERAEQILARLDLHLDVRRPLGEYPVAIQQMTAIARALDTAAQVLVLDEPTSSLDAQEVERLFGVMRRLRDEGLGVIFVTHFLDQVYAVSDRISVLRGGELVGTYAAAELPRFELVAKMIGRALNDLERLEEIKAELPESTAPPALSARDLGLRGVMQPVDLKLQPGRVLGLAGLLGSGRTELARLLFGVEQPDSGSLEMGGRPIQLRSPADALRHGIGMCPEDRRSDAIVPDLTVRENIVLALQARRGWLRALPLRAQLAIADRYIRALGIKVTSPEQPVRQLSGGNQQKVIVARWLATDPRVLILDEPTRGIDIGAKSEIQRLVLSLAEEGKAIMFISSELDEVIRCSHEVVVLRDRRKVAELSGQDVGEAQIMRAIAERPGDDHVHA